MRKLTGIEHVSDMPYVFTTSENTIGIKIKTPKEVVCKIDLGYNDPYAYEGEQWIEKVTSMDNNFSDDLYDWWDVEIQVDARRFMYHFKLHTVGGNVYYYTEAGLDDTWEVQYQFNLPFSHAEEVFTYPKWIDNTVWYQIFPERFATSDMSKYEGWHDGDVTNEELYGGNLKGIIAKLDYIKDLGVNAIYFTPIFYADSSHKYDTIDYFKIDPQFGTEDDFKNLIMEAHNRGIRVMLDGVFNHTSKNHPYFQDVVKNKEKSKYKEWFYINEFDNLENTLNLPDSEFSIKNPYNTFAYTPNMPKLNVSNPEARDYILEAAKYWTELGIDGWRLDVANEVVHHFWKDFKKAVTAINDQIYIVGEIWHDSISWLRGDEFHAVMNYKYTNAIIDYFFRKKIDLEKFEGRISRTLMEYTPTINKAAFNLFDSHDTMRVKNMCEFDVARQKLGTVFLFTQMGTPCIYYGTEIGLEGAGDPNNRRLMPWDENKWDHELLDFYKKIIKIRLDHPILANGGDVKFIENSTGICEYKRYSSNEEYTIVLNATDSVSEYVSEGKVIYAQDYEQGVLNVNGFAIIKNK